jgi:amino acid transporter
MRGSREAVSRLEVAALRAERPSGASHAYRLKRIDPHPQLARTLTLRSAIALNMLDMIGVGPFITLPLLLATMGGPQAMLGWICGAVLALSDGLVWAELGAAMPEAGGTYRFLRTIFPGESGRFLSFLFVFQLMFSAPLSVASGCIGLSQYAGFVLPVLQAPATHLGRIAFGPATLVAAASVLLAVVLLYRGLAHLKFVSYALWVSVIATIGWVLVVALTHGRLALAFTFPSGAFRLTPGFFSGLAGAMLITTYDFWGYYNVTFLGAEVRDPGRTIPRAILISIVVVTMLYLALNIALLTVVPWQPLVGAETVQSLAARQALVATFMQMAYGGAHGLLLGKLAAVLVMIAAFASVFSLLLGYSRIPYAAANDGNFPRIFARLDRRGRFPAVSLLYLGGAAVLFCFFSLAEVIGALVVLRIVVQFLLQHVGVMLLRRRRPEMPRPFRIWLYPLPPLVALAGFAYILLGRPHFAASLGLAAGVVAAGAIFYRLRRANGLSGV